MAKRQMDSSIIQQNWYMELNSRARNLWWHLFLSCDNIGVFEINTRLIGVYTGEKFSRQDIFSLFGGRVVPVPNHPEKGIIVDFVACQSRGGVQGNAPWQRAMRMRMQELGIDEQFLKDSACAKREQAEDYVREEGTQDELFDTDEAEEERIDYDRAFETFWEAYPSACPRKVDKKKCRAKFESVLDSSGNPVEAVAEIMEGLARWVKCETWVKDGGRYIRAPLVWLNNDCWKDYPKEYSDDEENIRSVGRKPTNWRKPSEIDDASVL